MRKIMLETSPLSPIVETINHPKCILEVFFRADVDVSSLLELQHMASGAKKRSQDPFQTFVAAAIIVRHLCLLISKFSSESRNSELVQLTGSSLELHSSHCD